MVWSTLYVYLWPNAKEEKDESIMFFSHPHSCLPYSYIFSLVCEHYTSSRSMCVLCSAWHEKDIIFHHKFVVLMWVKVSKVLEFQGNLLTLCPTQFNSVQLSLTQFNSVQLSSTHTDRNNLVILGIQVTQFLDLLFESTFLLVLSTENKTELTNW